MQAQSTGCCFFPSHRFLSRVTYRFDGFPSLTGFRPRSAVIATRSRGELVLD